MFPKCRLASPCSPSDARSTRRRRVRCGSHDPSRLPHHLLVSTDVSPVGAITAVRQADATPPDCRRQKGIRHRRGAPVSRSLRCHGADVSEAWFCSPRRGQDRGYQRTLIIYSQIQVDHSRGSGRAAVTPRLISVKCVLSGLL